MTIYRGTAAVPAGPAATTPNGHGDIPPSGPPTLRRFRRMWRLVRIRGFVPSMRIRLALANGLLLGIVTAGLVAFATGMAGEESLLLDVAAGAVVGAAAIVAGYVVVARALKPLQRVTATARRLSGETLDQRIHYTGPDDEVSELAATFDAMLDRLSSAFETQRRFVANASHELRTPLTVMRTEIDVTLADPDADLDEFRRMASVVRDASVRANALVDALLVLARSEGQIGPGLVRRIPVDLAAGVEPALAAAERDIARLGLDVGTEILAAPVLGDPSLLERLAGNLIENAVRYNTGNGRVWIRTGMSGGDSVLVVGNTGFEVDAADVPKMFEPFRRGGRDRTGSGRGSGLGLSIARAICSAHGGSIGVVPQEGGGLEVTVTIPAAPPA